MATGVNKTILVGRLGQDPEIRHTQNGEAVATLSLATSEKWKDKQTGNDVTKTEWHRIIFFKRKAEVAQQYLKKGSLIYVEGKLQTRKWQDQSGIDRYTIEIVGNDLQMLGGGNQGEQQQAQQQQQYAQQPQQPQGVDGFDDDIPF